MHRGHRLGQALRTDRLGPDDDRQGWLCDPPLVDPPVSVHPVHREFWGVCGGIVERFGEPEESWWVADEDVLTAAAVQTSLTEPLHSYSWFWEDAGLTIPIDPADYYVVSVEASGNLTCAHRESGEIILFAPDHDYDNVTPFPGCPEFSLMTIDGVSDLTAWIETCAAFWGAT